MIDPYDGYKKSLVLSVIFVALLVYTVAKPVKVERGGVLAAVSVCSKNDGIMSIKRGYFDTYTIICRNSAKFEDMKVIMSETEPEDNYEIKRKANGNQDNK